MKNTEQHSVNVDTREFAQHDIAELTDAIMRLKLELAESRTRFIDANQVNRDVSEKNSALVCKMAILAEERDILLIQNKQLRFVMMQLQKNVTDSEKERVQLRVWIEKLQTELDGKNMHKKRCEELLSENSKLKEETNKLEATIDSSHLQMLRVVSDINDISADNKKGHKRNPSRGKRKSIQNLFSALTHVGELVFSMDSSFKAETKDCSCSNLSRRRTMCPAELKMERQHPSRRASIFDAIKTPRKNTSSTVPQSMDDLSLDLWQRSSGDNCPNGMRIVDFLKARSFSSSNIPWRPKDQNSVLSHSTYTTIESELSSLHKSKLADPKIDNYDIKSQVKTHVSSSASSKELAHERRTKVLVGLDASSTSTGGTDYDTCVEPYKFTRNRKKSTNEDQYIIQVTPNAASVMPKAVCEKQGDDKEIPSQQRRNTADDVQSFLFSMQEFLEHEDIREVLREGKEE